MALDNAFPVAVVKLDKDCGHVRKYREVRKDEEASTMMTPSEREGEKDGLFYLRHDHMDSMVGARPIRGRLWFEPLDD